MLQTTKTNINKFLPHVMAMVQGDARNALPSEVALSYIRNSIIAFAEKSQVLNRTETIPFEEKVYVYPIVDSNQERVYYVEQVTSIASDCNIPVRGFRDHLLELEYSPTDRDTSFMVDFVAVPLRSSCSVDTRIYEEWHDAIVAGALMKLHAMPQKTWTSGALVRLNSEEFYAAIKRARRLKVRNRNGASSRVQANQRYVGYRNLHGYQYSHAGRFWRQR